MQPTPPERATMEKALADALAIVRALPTVTPCDRCAHFLTGANCDYWKAHVPEEARAAGCAEWAEPIPF